MINRIGSDKRRQSHVGLFGALAAMEGRLCRRRARQSCALASPRPRPAIASASGSRLCRLASASPSPSPSLTSPRLARSPGPRPRPRLGLASALALALAPPSSLALARAIALAPSPPHPRPALASMLQQLSGVAAGGSQLRPPSRHALLSAASAWQWGPGHAARSAPQLRANSVAGCRQCSLPHLPYPRHAVVGSLLYVCSP